MTEDEFADVIRTVEGYWPGKPFAEGTIDLWWSQMQSWRADLLMSALPGLAREFHWIPSFAQMAEAYRIEVTKNAPREKAPRHLSAISDPEMRDRWTRVIHTQLATGSFGEGRGDQSPLAKAIRRHYRHEPHGRGVIVMDGAKMLADAEQAIADTAFGTGGD